MTPQQFWTELFASMMQFVLRMYQMVFNPMVNTIIVNPILLLVFGYIVLNIVISIIKEMYL